MSTNIKTVQIDMNKFREVFFEEATENLATLETGLLRLEEDPNDVENLNTIFRCAHSIKGASGTFGFNDIAKFTHVLESLLEHVRSADIAVTQELSSVLLRATDIMGGLIEAGKNNEPPPDSMEEVMKDLQSLIPGQHGSSNKVAASNASHNSNTKDDISDKQKNTKIFSIRFFPSLDLFRQGMDPSLLLRELFDLGEFLHIEPDLTRFPNFSETNPEDCYLGWNIFLETTSSIKDIREIFSFIEDTSDIGVREVQKSMVPTAKQQATTATNQKESTNNSANKTKEADKTNTEPEKSNKQIGKKHGENQEKNITERPQAHTESYIRVSTDKVDKLIDLMGEVVIAQSMMIQIVEHFSLEKLAELQEALLLMERNTREMQERVMSIRMVPVGSIFSRFPRLVRDLSNVFGKKMSLVVQGEETEIDKGVAEHLADPLTHLLRNAIDHGLETPEERLNAGKPEIGTIKLMAYHEGGNVVIEVGDDGRGLNTERIRKKALEQGLIPSADGIAEEHIHALIFHPGFSTAQTVSEYSGRGVGMDVVKQNIESLNGNIQILSELGKGTRFKIRLPLTLAILDGLTLRVGKQIYIIPLLAILESLRPTHGQLKSVFGRGEVIVVRGESLPLLRLYQLLATHSSITDPSKGLVVIVENEGQRLGILVDELLGQTQVVIKNLERNFQRIEGVMGATIMGDGKVALILDIQGLGRLAVQKHGLGRNS